MGVRRNLLTLGSVIRVGKYRGQQEDFEGEVVAVRDTKARPLTDRLDKTIKRSRYLVTLKGLGSEPEYKSYYSHFVSKVHVVKKGDE